MLRVYPSRRTLAIVLWIACFVGYSLLVGLPTKRGNVLIWIALAVLALGVDHPRATIRSFTTTWLPLFTALAAYDLLRGSSHGSEASAATWPQLDIDQWLGGGTTPTEHLQNWLWNAADPRWWDTLAWVVYQSHFFVPLLVAVLLWSQRHRLATPYIIGIAALSWMALATYWLYPAQPPWMTARDGLTGEVTRIVHQMWRDIGVERAARVFSTERSHGNRYSNTVAALPSLHAAFPMFITVMLWSRRRWLNLLLSCYTLAMGLTLVYAGEHFTFDIALGWAYALAIGLVMRNQKIFTSRMRSSRPDPHASDGTGGNEATTAAEPASRNR